MQTIYREEQGFGAISIILIVEAIAVCALVIGIDYSQGSWKGSAIAVPLILLVNGFILYIRLITEIDNQHIQFAMRPFVKKTIYWRDVEKAEVINYGWVGGWGVKRSKKYGNVYNTSGSKGLHLVLKNGKQMVIGTQKEKELKAFLEQLKNNTT
jgi:hypothetical protein